jgi:hypothetical protein
LIIRRLQTRQDGIVVVVVVDDSLQASEKRERHVVAVEERN